MRSPTTLAKMLHVDQRRAVSWALVIGLVSCGLIAVPFLFYYDQELQRARETALTNQKHAAELASTTIAQTLAFVVSDLRHLSDQNELKDFLAEDSPLHRTRIAEEHSAFLNQKPSYDQVRLTGSDGWELIRVDRRGGGVTITPADRLQEEAKRPLFVETMRLGAGEIYVGPMDLNVEEGSIEEPPNPALPVALPLFDASGHKVAVLALHLHAEQLLARLRAITPPDGSELSLLNGEGYWLLTPSAADEWAFMYPDRADRNLPARDPETWRRLSDAESGAFDTPEGLLVFAHLHPLLPTEPLALQARHLRQPAAAADYHWTIVAKLPTAVLRSQKVTLAGQLLVAYIAVAILAFGLSSMIAFLALRSRAISRFVQHVLDHVPALIAYIDADERFRFNNRHYQTMFGLPPGDFWGSTVRSILGDAAYERARPHIKTALAGTSVSFEASMTYAVAGRCDISATYIPDTGEDGRIWGFLAVVTDVTPLKAAESRERQRLLEIAHATRLASVGEMATQIAHEVNQPLTAIVAYCATAQRCLQAALPGDSRLDRLLGFITDDANRVSSIVRRIRSFVRRGQISVATIDMNEIVADSLRFVASDAASHGVTLSRQLAREPLNVVADRVLLSQATFNLLRNAIEAIAGGTGGERLVTVSTRRRSQAVEVSVRDTGAGLAPEMSAHLFEAFMTTKPEGLGMGLSIARSIIEAHGGRIHYSHTVEDGTTFSFIVPGGSP